ncbi:MAG: DUF2087 domain-containing protein [Firmicutes bacterium]|nr:DUF2087 domain-containing protein [Bacillota bacterium]
MEESPRLWLADVEAIKRGYVYEPEDEEYACLVCGRRFSRGIIYPVDDCLADAEQAVKLHLRSEHGSMFEYLLGMDKRYTGLTEHQKEVLLLVHQGMSDREIAQRLNTGSTSTIRNHRFSFREREKTAKVFLAIMGLLKADSRGRSSRPAMDDRSDEEKVLAAYLREGPKGPLSRLPKKASQRLMVLRHLAGRFEPGREYAEKEVNQVLREVYHDHVTLRRNMVDYGILDRLPDGSRYWVTTEDRGREPGAARPASERRRLKNDYQQNPPPGGVYQIRNLADGRVLVGSGVNLSGAMNRSRFELDRGVHPNQELQQDWNRFGPEGFSFESLESFTRDGHPGGDLAEEVRAAETRWLEKLKPYGGRGYNHE